MWRFSFAALLLGLSVSVQAAKGFYAAAEEWVTSKHEINGKTAAVRVNIALPAMGTQREFPRSLRFIAPFNVHNERPFPERLDRDGLEKIEEAIENKLVDEGIAIFASIITVNNSREFLLYVGDTEQAQRIAEWLVAEVKSHKLSFRLESDPEWEAWYQYSGEARAQR